MVWQALEVVVRVDEALVAFGAARCRMGARDVSGRTTRLRAFSTPCHRLRLDMNTYIGAIAAAAVATFGTAREGGQRCVAVIVGPATELAAAGFERRTAHIFAFARSSLGQLFEPPSCRGRKAQTLASAPRRRKARPWDVVRFRKGMGSTLSNASALVPQVSRVESISANITTLPFEGHMLG